MMFQSHIPDSFLRKMELISTYIVKEIGGITEWIEYKNLNLVKIRWKKFTNNGHTIFLEELVSYDELLRVIDPELIGKKFVDNYNERVKQDG